MHGMLRSSAVMASLELGVSSEPWPCSRMVTPFDKPNIHLEYLSHVANNL